MQLVHRLTECQNVEPCISCEMVSYSGRLLLDQTVHGLKAWRRYLVTPSLAIKYGGWNEVWCVPAAWINPFFCRSWAQQVVSAAHVGLGQSHRLFVFDSEQVYRLSITSPPPNAGEVIIGHNRSHDVPLALQVARPTVIRAKLQSRCRQCPTIRNAYTMMLLQQRTATPCGRYHCQCQSSL